MPQSDFPSGYANEDQYYATRYEQGRRTVYGIDLSLLNISATLPRPDPNRPTPGNRRVKDSHARSFAKYVRENATWVSPALILRAPDIFSFDVREKIGGTEFGIMGVPRLARNDLRILDGQHRILGLHYAVEGINNEIEQARGNIAAARRQENPELEAHHRTILDGLLEQRRRFDTERISVQIQIEDDQRAFMLMFVDIADNALGISSAIRARFDARKVVNRALDDVLKHALLQNRVDLEQDRIGGTRPYLLGAKHVADIIRTVTVGIGGRVGRRQEDELHEAELVEKTNDFLDVLVGGFPVLDDVVEGKVTPEELRRKSLLGSTTMLRVLAGAFHDLITDYSDGDIQDFFSSLAPFMKAPAGQDSVWVETGVVTLGATAPMARNQDMRLLVDTIVNWARQKPSWLQAAS